MKDRIRAFLRRFGIDVVRYPLHDPLARTAQLLEFYGIECVVDVGANDGGFATGIRQMGYAGRIVSFEPLSDPFESLKTKSLSDPRWDAFKYAVGNVASDVKINVSGNRGLSSSLLPMLESHSDVAPKSRYVGTETVKQERLDVLLPDLGIDLSRRTYLKIDVQGYEHAVLEGCSGLLSSGQVVGLQLELSLIPLYAGAMSYREGLDFAESHGMTLMGLDPVFANPRTGQLLQADAVFFSPNGSLD